MNMFLRIRLIALLSVVFFSACAGMGTTGQRYTGERLLLSNITLDQPAAIELARSAFDRQGIEVTGQHPQSGYLSGKLNRGSWINRVSYLVEVRLTIPGPDRVKVSATAIAGPEVAFTSELDGIVNDFIAEFESLLQP